MEEALTARVLAMAPLIAIIDNRATWGQRVPGEPVPAVTMIQISPGRFYLHSGADGTGSPRVQFDCYGSNAAEALAVKKALIAGMEQRATHNGIAFSVALLDAERGPMFEDVGGGDKTVRYSLDFFVWFSPAA